MELKKLLKEKQFFFWDFDGCFCDSEKTHFLAYQKAFAHFGHTLPEENYYLNFTHFGDGTDKEISRHSLSVSVEAVRALKNKFYAELIREPNQALLFREMRAIINKIKAKNAKLAIVSNSSFDDIFYIVNREGLADKIDLFVTGSLALPKKPAPDLYKKALSEMGADPRLAIAFEDSERGLLAANRAGLADSPLQAIWVKTSYNDTFSTHADYQAFVSHEEIEKAL